jgi:hypothetical protein
MPIDALKLAEAVEGACMEWMGERAKKGYGRVWVGGRRVYAHRHAYEIARGPIPHGLVIDHVCNNPPCVNPSHLRVVSVRFNTLRGIGPSAVAARKVACPRGHPYEAPHLEVRKDGSRVCRTCRRVQQRESYYRVRIRDGLPTRVRAARDA